MQKETKKCTTCGEIKSLSEFNSSGRGINRLRCCCKPCNKIKMVEWRAKNKDKITRTHLKKKYGITQEDWNILYEKQNGCCAICNTYISALKDKILCVDHCHKTGKIRGLLCHKCNKALGGLNDDPELLQRALDYLK